MNFMDLAVLFSFYMYLDHHGVEFKITECDKKRGIKLTCETTVDNYNKMYPGMFDCFKDAHETKLTVPKDITINGIREFVIHIKFEPK